MYLHIGQNKMIRMSDIIGIFDLDTSTVSKRTRQFLSQAEKNGDVVNITGDLPKTFIICSDAARKSGRVIYISQISSATLLKRAQNFASNTSTEQLM